MGGIVEPRISAHEARALLGVKQSQFQRLVRQGHFGQYICYSDSPFSARYYIRRLVEEFIRERERQANPAYQEAITQEMIKRIKQPKAARTTKKAKHP